MKLIKLLMLTFTIFLTFLSCTKEPIEKKAPIAKAGTSQSIRLPVNTVTLTGSGTTVEGSIKGYLWSLISGPNVPVIYSPSSPTTKIGSLLAGIYVIQFAVTDTYGLTGIDTVSIVVNPSLQQTVKIQPSNNPYEGYFDIYYPTSWFTNVEIPIGAWTSYGSPETYRACIKFDYSLIPAGSVIDSAALLLYAMPVPLGGNITDAHFGTSNVCNVQRITSSFVATVNPFTWVSQPSFTTANATSIPQSTTGYQDDVIDVTKLVQDMYPSKNNGFLITLQNEVYYNLKQYASSYYKDPSKHPALIIKYH